MEYRSITNFLISICFMIMAVGLGLYVWKGGTYYLAIIPGALLLVTVLVLKIPIDNWYFKRNPPRLDDQLVKALTLEYPILKTYSPEELENFNQNLARFILDKDAYLVVSETEELDTTHTAIMSAPAVFMQGKNEFDPYDHIQKLAAYRHPFPSPKMKFLHPVEMDMEDGVAIISIEQMFAGLRNKKRFYSVVYHLWSEHYYQHHGIDDEMIPTDFTSNIPKIFPYDRKAIDNLLGYKGARNAVIAMVAYWTFPVQLKATYPELFNYFDELFVGTEVQIVKS